MACLDANIMATRLIGYFIDSACIASMHLQAEVMKNYEMLDKEMEHLNARYALYKGINEWKMVGMLIQAVTFSHS